jgi:hypothetical protein
VQDGRLTLSDEEERIRKEEKHGQMKIVHVIPRTNTGLPEL